MLTHILIGFAAVIGWCLFVLASPTGTCRRCNGKRVIRSHVTGRMRPCWRCKATGRRYRLGAVRVHRFAWSVAGEALGRRIRARYEREDPR